VTAAVSFHHKKDQPPAFQGILTVYPVTMRLKEKALILSCFLKCLLPAHEELTCKKGINGY
jgi:hypothetical protein